MNALKIDYKAEQVIDLFEKIWSWDEDLNSWVGLHFIEWCKKQNYKNPSFQVFVETCAFTRKGILKELENLKFKYRTFASRYIADEEKEPFLNFVYKAHHEHFQGQIVRGFES
ncbi:hypothetical protein V7151_25215 [Priestia megaterium]|uniref:hypothetical protein n=1 Tax=Priestia megaterium TaxID=1404 RepID=UPI002FFEFB5F